jgi:glycosyltransferase involved in cell wall biosynthesis
MKQCNVMIGPVANARGGISTVISQYQHNGFFTALDVVYLPTFTPGNALRKLATTASSFLRLLLMLIAGRVDIIHIHTASFNSFYRKAAFAWLGYLFRRPVVLHIHGGKFIEFVDGTAPAMRALILRTLRNATRIIALSPHWGEVLASALALDRKQIRVLPNPVSTGDAQRAPGPATHDLLFLGDIVRKKGVYDLVDAVAALRERGLPVELRCGGTGEIAALQDYAASRGVGDALHMLGWIDAARKREEFQRAALFVLPSYFEGLPMTILEAMAAGVPVLASTVGGIPDLLDGGRLGWLTPAGDSEKLATSIEQILRDPQQVEQKTRSARQAIAAIYEPQAVCRQLAALYREIATRG